MNIGTMEIQGRSGRAVRRGFRASLLVVAIAVAMFLLPELANECTWQRDGFGARTWFTLLTSHFTHFTWEHLAWDAFALLVVGTLAGHAGMRRWVLAAFSSALLIPLAVFVFQPSILAYRGLSGIGSALFALAAVHLLRSQIEVGNHKGAWAIGFFILAFAGKIVWEVNAHTAVFAQNLGEGNIPVALAHIVGGACGAIAACIPNRVLQGNSRENIRPAASL